MNVADLTTLSHGADIDLFEIDYNPIGVEKKLYFCNYGNTDGTNLSWGGQEYEVFPIAIEGEGAVSSGEPPRPRLKVGNPLTTSLIAADLRQYDDMVGVWVIRHTTYVKHLDGQEDPNGDAEYPIGYYRIDRKASEDELEIILELAPFDFGNSQIPKRVVTYGCSWEYRGTECSFDGAPVADFDDSPLTELEVTGVDVAVNRIASASANAFSGVSVGDFVTGSGLQNGTKVLFINGDASEVTLSKVPSAGSGINLYFSGDSCGRRSGSAGESGSCKIRHGAEILTTVTASSDTITTPSGESAKFLNLGGAFVHTSDINAGMPVARQITQVLAGSAIGILSISLDVDTTTPPPSTDTFTNPPGTEKRRRHLITTSSNHGIQVGDRITIQGWPAMDGEYSITSDDLNANADEFLLFAQPREIKDITIVGGLATIETWSPHGLTNGESVYFDGSGEALLNQQSKTITVINSTSFSVSVPGSIPFYRLRGRTSYRGGNYLQPLANQDMTGIAADNDEGVYYRESPAVTGGATVSRLGVRARLNAAVYPWAVSGDYLLTYGSNQIYDPNGLPFGGSPGAQLTAN